MQEAEVVLSILSQKSAHNSAYVFDRLYRNLFNPDFYRLAYSNIDAKEGNMSAGVEGEAVDGFNVYRVEEIIAQLKQERYYPQPVATASVPHMRGTQPTFLSLQDELVQEVIRLLLQAIYEPVFRDSSHGFRPGRSCHTALIQLKNTCKGTNWVIKGDITDFFESIDHARLLAVLSRKVSDGRFLNLLNRFLKAGYLAFWHMHNSLAGTPRGGIVSSILANIYLHEFDVFMEQTCNQLTAREVTGERTSTCQELNLERFYARKNGEERQADAALKQKGAVRTRIFSRSNDWKVRYIRYADAFVVMIVGSKDLAEQIRESMRDFLERELQLELNREKTLLTNLADRRMRFLGYEVTRSRKGPQYTEDARGVKTRASGGSIHLLVPGDVIRESLKPFVRNGKAIHHNARINIPLLDLLAQYNAEIRGLYNYYSLASDVSKKLGTFRYYHYYSLLKTVARKEQCSITRVLSKYGVEVKQKQKTGTRRIFGVPYQTKAGPKTLTYFNESLRKKDEPAEGAIARGVLEIARSARRQVFDHRPGVSECELCGRRAQECGALTVHRIRQLKDVRRAYVGRGEQVPLWVLAMYSLRRKTLVVCKACLGVIYAGQQNGSARTTVREAT
jgi:group II intron reverse transcriptase/maturase